MADKQFEEKTDWLGNKYYEDSKTGERLSVESQLFGSDHIVVRDKAGNVTSTIEQGRDFLTGQTKYDVRSPSYDFKGSISSEYVPFLGDSHVQRDNSGSYQGTIEADIFSKTSGDIASSSHTNSDRRSASNPFAGNGESNHRSFSGSSDFAHGAYDDSDSGATQSFAKHQSSQSSRIPGGGHSIGISLSGTALDIAVGIGILAVGSIIALWIIFASTGGNRTVVSSTASTVPYRTTASSEVERAAKDYFAAKSEYLTAKTNGDTRSQRLAEAKMRSSSNRLAKFKQDSEASNRK